MNFTVGECNVTLEVSSTAVLGLCHCWLRMNETTFGGKGKGHILLNTNKRLHNTKGKQQSSQQVNVMSCLKCQALTRLVPLLAENE